MAAVVRRAEEDDAEGVLAIYAPIVRDTAISFELEPPPAATMRERIRELRDRMPYLVCADGREVWGYAYADRLRARPAYQWSAEVTVYVSPHRQRRGAAQALYTSLLAGLRLLGYRNAFAAIALPNPASVALHEGLGFFAVGSFRAVGYKHGAWHDVGWWQLGLGPPGDPAGPPRTVAEMADRPEWAAAVAAGLDRLRSSRGPS